MSVPEELYVTDPSEAYRETRQDELVVELLERGRNEGTT